MKLTIFYGFLFMLAGFGAKSTSLTSLIDKNAYYAAISSDNVAVIDAQLTMIKTGNFAEKDAYEGALLMKKAGLVSKTKEKMDLFKSGRSKMEAAIKKDGNNAEYRFLRLIIQENAPKIANYHGDLQSDSEIVRTNYKNLPQVVQQSITEYSKKSKVLKLS